MSMMTSRASKIVFALAYFMHNNNNKNNNNNSNDPAWRFYDPNDSTKEVLK